MARVVQIFYDIAWLLEAALCVDPCDGGRSILIMDQTMSTHLDDKQENSSKTVRYTKSVVDRYNYNKTLGQVDA